MKPITRKNNKSIRAMTAKWHADRYGENQDNKEACNGTGSAKARHGVGWGSRKRDPHV